MHGTNVFLLQILISMITIGSISLGSDDYLTEDCILYFNEIFLEQDKTINLFTAKSFFKSKIFLRRF